MSLAHGTLRYLEERIAGTEYARSSRSIQPQLVNLSTLTPFSLLLPLLVTSIFPGIASPLPIPMFVCMCFEEAVKVPALEGEVEV
jgi:hypothetical protein